MAHSSSPHQNVRTVTMRTGNSTKLTQANVQAGFFCIFFFRFVFFCCCSISGQFILKFGVTISPLDSCAYVRVGCERGMTRKVLHVMLQNIDQRCPISLNKHIDKVNAVTKEFLSLSFSFSALLSLSLIFSTFKCQHVLYHAPFHQFDLMRFCLVFAIAFQLQI